MAKSKSGGTRSYLRGRVGSDVDSIGKDGKGKKQQVIRSLAEQVKNPQTQAQMRGRMIMSTVMQAQSALVQIVDHSFDGIAAGQPSISEFIRRNYALIKADVAVYHEGGNSFGLNKYQEKGAKVGAYVVSDGQAVNAAGAAIGVELATLTLPTITANTEVSDVLSTIGIAKGDYITFIYIDAAGTVAFVRVGLKDSVALDTIVTAANVASMFFTDGQGFGALTYDSTSNKLQLVPAIAQSGAQAKGIITTRKELSGYQHSACVLSVTGSPSYTADVALPTYPQGTEQFLNGGEL